MSETKFTRGPWFSQWWPDLTVEVIQDDGNRVALIDSGSGHDANLIAASPMLFNALCGLLERYVNLANSGDAGFWDPEEEPEVIASRVAISKAEGRLK